MVRSLAIAALLLVGVNGSLAGAEWDPWPNQRVVSKNGEYYVVMKRLKGRRFVGEWGPVQFWVAKRGPGSGPVRPTESEIIERNAYDYRRGSRLYELRRNADVSVRPGDTVLGWGLLDRPPGELHVLSSGRGFVGLDVWGNNYVFNRARQNLIPAVLVFNARGSVLHRLRLRELFQEHEVDGLSITSAGMHWLHSSWLREEKDELAILAPRGEQRRELRMVRFIDLETGSVRHLNIAE